MTSTLGQNKSVTESEQSLLNRVKRLSVALYRLTSFFDVNEPMRQSIRARAIILMDMAVSLKDLKRPVNELLSYTDVLLYSDLLSETNVKILKDELVSLMSQAERHSAGETSPFFGLADLLPNLPEQVSGQTRTLRGGDERLLKAEPESQKDKRQSAITAFINKNGGANVRDLMAVVRGCSEKTIQRELASLIARGVLKREGERRWSKYLLAGTS